MPRAFPHSHVAHGQIIGFSVKKFRNVPTYFACFRDGDGRRLKRDTNQTSVQKAVDAAKAIIEKEFTPTNIATEKFTWDQAVEKLKARLVTAGVRATTIGYYEKLLRSVRKMYESTDGPADISPGMAARWRDTLMTVPGRRKKAASAHYVAGMLLGLSGLWNKWFVEGLGIVPDNPWADVEPPKADKLPVKFATDEQLEQFYAWITERFGDWSFPKLFLSTKAYTGCRLMDLCSLTSGQLRGGRLVFPPNLTKGRKERAVPLPNDLQAALVAFKGETYLWERYPQGLKVAIETKGWPTHQLKVEFLPRRLYFWVETLFGDYRKAFPFRPPLTTHMFRKRAFTMAWEKGIDPRRAAIAYGCNVDTLMRHYVSMDEQQVTDDVFAEMNGGNKGK